MLFQRFLKRISELIPDRLVSGDLEALARLNPEKFYVENVRSVLGVSSSTAQRICDTAVRQGAFQKCVEVVYPGETLPIFPTFYTIGTPKPPKAACSLSLTFRPREYHHTLAKST